VRVLVIKKLINEPDRVVRDMLEGMELAFPEIIRLDPQWNNVYRRYRKPSYKVALLSGGGSGHEPAFAGYVGYGMLDAVCAGHVYTAPTVPQVYSAIKEIATDAGIWVFFGNYTGDLMNFVPAIEMARREGIKIDYIAVNDDVAIPVKEKRRGTTIHILVHKIVGAAAEEGYSFEEVGRVARKVIESGRDIGVALTPSTMPTTGKPTFELPEDEIEFGIGVHGEPGIKRMKVVSSRELAKLMIDKITEDLKLQKGDEVALIVQGTGGTPYMEKFIFYRDARKYVEEALGLKVYVSWVGEFITSLDMQGGRIAILKLDDELKRLLVAPALTIAIKIPPPNVVS
jgi:dihydroxyacetone kinase-like protein